MKEKLFLTASKYSAKRLTEVFDFVWPTAAAMWNLRWQIQGYIANTPTASDAELVGRFVAGSGIHGANLRRASIDKTWDEQQQEFARFLLVEFCSLYETWCEGSLQELSSPASHSKKLQFPTKIVAGVPTGGVGYVLASLLSSKSTVLSASLYPELIKNKKYSMPHLEALLTCYRYFKELRNSMVHQGGASSQIFLAAEAAYASLSEKSLGVSEKPDSLPQVTENGISISLRGVVGFGEIILKLICTLDAELTKSSAAEKLFIKRWKNKHGGIIMIKAKRSDRINRIKKLVRQLELPTPTAIPLLDIWLQSQKFIN